MAANQIIEVELDGDEEPLRVTADGRDVRWYESESGQSSLVGPMSLTMLAMMAYSAGRRQKLWAMTWEEFDEKCLWVKPISGETAGPTRPARGGGSSSRSRSGQGSASSSGKKQGTPPS